MVIVSWGIGCGSKMNILTYKVVQIMEAGQYLNAPF